MAFALVSGADWAKVVYFKIYAAFTGTAVHSSPVWMDAPPLCDCGICRTISHIVQFSFAHLHILSYLSLAFGPRRMGVSPNSSSCYEWFAVPVKLGRIEAQTIYFSVPCQMGAAVPPDPPSGSSRSFPGDCTYYYICILCYIFGGAAAPRNSWAGVGILMAISYIFYFSLLPLGALSNSLRVSRSLLARRAALCQHSMDPKRLSYTVILFGGPFQSILFSVAFIQEFPWRCARCALPKSEYLVCSNLCPWRGAQRSKCHYIIWPCFVVKIWH